MSITRPPVAASPIVNSATFAIGKFPSGSSSSIGLESVRSFRLTKARPPESLVPSRWSDGWIESKSLGSDDVVSCSVVVVVVDSLDAGEADVVDAWRCPPELVDRLGGSTADVELVVRSAFVATEPVVIVLESDELDRGIVAVVVVDVDTSFVGSITGGRGLGIVLQAAGVQFEVWVGVFVRARRQRVLFC